MKIIVDQLAATTDQWFKILSFDSNSQVCMKFKVFKKNNKQ